MRKLLPGLVALAALTTPLLLAAPSGGASPGAAPPTRAAAPPATDQAQAVGPHELPNPLEEKRRELREQAVSDVVSGRVTPEQRGSSTVVRVGDADAGPAGNDVAGRRAGERRGQYVELARERTDRIFVVLAEFGDERHPDYPDQDTDPEIPGPARFDGPARNEIPAPDRRVDNSTVWQPDYSQQHYQDLYFGPGQGNDSVKTYYERQSSGRYSVDGTVTDWVKVRYNEARYGRSDGFPCADNVCDNTWNLIADAVDQWVADQEAAGRTDAEIQAELASFDQWDRYDHDLDGNFDEPDGYLDHFQVVHAGGDQADGDPHQGEDAIWSHRWYAWITDAGLTGPATNPLGGTEIGDTGLWVGDYTIQPENGGLSVFVHEYGHDLGLPDAYDTSGGGDNSNEYWTLMAQSRLSGRGEPLGTRAGDLGAWEKLQLGWLDYELVRAGDARNLDLGPSEYNTAKPQAAVVVLPQKEVTSDYGAPAAGERFWWSGSGDDLANTMTREVDLTGKTTASLALQARFDIEAEYDYLYVQTSTDGGATWTARDGTVDGEPFVRDGSDQPAISGSSGGEWVDVAVPLDDLAGAPVLLRFLYRTDGGVAPDGFFADEIVVTVDGAAVVTSGAEDGDEGWTLDGFTSTTGIETGLFDNYYIAASRTYVANDQWLRTGPYNFGFPDRPDWVEHYPYQEGLLISYWDTSQADNNTSEHPGLGRNLPIDSRPRPLVAMDGSYWRARLQVYDAPFSTRKADSFTLHAAGRPSYVRGQAAAPTFDDGKQYWFAALPNHGVKVPDAGVRITVQQQRADGMRIRITGT